jgi:hypothetical protein
MDLQSHGLSMDGMERLAYVVLMTAAGWREGFDPTFTIVPGMARNVLYGLRLSRDSDAAGIA